MNRPNITYDVKDIDGEIKFGVMVVAFIVGMILGAILDTTTMTRTIVWLSIWIALVGVPLLTYWFMSFFYAGHGLTSMQENVMLVYLDLPESSRKAFPKDFRKAVMELNDDEAREMYHNLSDVHHTNIRMKALDPVKRERVENLLSTARIEAQVARETARDMEEI